MAQVEELLAAAREAGLEVRIENDELVIRGPRTQDALARRVLAEKPVVLALLSAEDAAVAWRVAAMRPQVPLRGAIPVLVARDVASSPGYCISCGELLPDRVTVRCVPCNRATWAALHEMREDVTLEIWPERL